jgi:hypothetical protein
LITRRSAIQILGLGVLLVGTRLAVDLTSAAAYVYPSFDFGQFWFAFLLFLASLVFVAILAIIRLFRRRLAEGIALLAVLCVPFLFKDVVDRHQWKFRLHKSDYQSAIKADPDQPPKYRVFSWGNRNTHSMGGGVILEAIVYDESDGITGRSPEWMKRRSSSSPEELWITARPNPSCKRRTEYLGEHFYYVSEEC